MKAPCDNPGKCINCNNNDHSSTSYKCPVWINETEIIKLKVDKKISFEEARKEVNARTKLNFADTTKKGLDENFKKS